MSNEEIKNDDKALAALLHQLKMQNAPAPSQRTESSLRWKDLEVQWKDDKYTLRLWRPLPNGGRIGESLLPEDAAFGAKAVVRKLLECLSVNEFPSHRGNKSQS